MEEKLKQLMRNATKEEIEIAFLAVLTRSVDKMTALTGISLEICMVSMLYQFLEHNKKEVATTNTPESN